MAILMLWFPQELVVIVELELLELLELVWKTVAYARSTVHVIVIKEVKFEVDFDSYVFLR